MVRYLWGSFSDGDPAEAELEMFGVGGLVPHHVTRCGQREDCATPAVVNVSCSQSYGDFPSCYWWKTDWHQFIAGPNRKTNKSCLLIMVFCKVNVMFPKHRDCNSPKIFQALSQNVIFPLEVTSHMTLYVRLGDTEFWGKKCFHQIFALYLCITPSKNT